MGLFYFAVFAALLFQFLPPFFRHLLKCVCFRQNVHNFACIIVKTHSAPPPPLPSTFLALAQGLSYPAEFVSQKILSFCHPQKLKHCFFKCRKPVIRRRLGCGHFRRHSLKLCDFFEGHLADDAIVVDFHHLTPHTDTESPS